MVAMDNKKCLDLLFSDKSNYEILEINQPQIRKKIS